jgi:archaellum component FlaC
MDGNMIWSSGLSLILGMVAFFLKEKSNDLKRIEILLNRTREEIAKGYVTNDELNKITEHIDQRFNKLENKIDQLLQQGAK